MALLIDHERAKSAYEMVGNFWKSEVPLPEGLQAPDLSISNLKANVECDGGYLRCFGPMSEKDADRLKEIDSDNEQWETAINSLYNIVKKKDFEKFRTWALKFPSTMQNCGLLQTIALCQEKVADVYNIAAEWLNSQFFGGSAALNEITQRVYAMNLNNYRYATRELIEYMSWVKRATSILLPEKED